MAIFDIFKKKNGKKPVVPATVEPPLNIPATEGEKPLKRAHNVSEGKKSATNGAINAAPETERSSEEICGITPGMPIEEIRAHLARLFKRHNRGASSLDEKTRLLAENMLDAIVEVRSKYLT